MFHIPNTHTCFKCGIALNASNTRCDVPGWYFCFPCYNNLQPQRVDSEIKMEFKGVPVKCECASRECKECTPTFLT